MRLLNILSGIAILITTAAYAHMLHHFSKEAANNNPVFWAGMVFAVIVGIFAFIGACVLLRRRRG